jgi:hemerythrin-like domain-containing protein
MDAFELLKNDHRKVAELFDRLESASGKTKLTAFRQIKSELDLHTHIEETIFYPALEDAKETHDLTLEAYEEHKVVKELLAELSGASSANDEWQATAKVLRENIEHHVDEEENELFDKAQDALGDEQIEKLGDRMAAEKARKLGRPVSEVAAEIEKPGILRRVAEFVGVAAARTMTRKRAGAKKTRTQKRSATRSRKASSARRARKTSSRTATKKADASRAAKQTRASTKRTNTARSRKKTTKKRDSRKR